jgi:glyoxylase-like metal-dependent hydrolase (beta-lactamase superfamily II)
MGMRETWRQDLGEGITCIDTGYVRPRLAACYLVEAGDQAAFIDCGIPRSLPGVLEVLRERGIAAEQVAYVIPTHVHLDHAGGAGAMMRAFPQARLVVHPRGARHLIDPSKLIAGVKAVYGEAAYRDNFGELVPVAADRVIEAPDGFALDLDVRRLTFYDSPGHARHHFCVHDDRSQGIFTGDTFGLSYREFDTPKGPFLFATTTPVQFDPDAWYRTLDRLLALEARRLYLTHFSSVELTQSLASRLRESIGAFVEIALAEEASGEMRRRNIAERMRALLLEGLQAHGCELPESECESLLAPDIDLNAQGLDVWLSGREEETKDR